MEEQKKNKTIKMDVTSPEEKKLSYEQLNDVCNQLWRQNQQLIKKNQELVQLSMFKRLDYLFKVVEHPTVFEGDFLITCVDEIKEALSPQEVAEEKEV